MRKQSEWLKRRKDSWQLAVKFITEAKVIRLNCEGVMYLKINRIVFLGLICWVFIVCCNGQSKSKQIDLLMTKLYERGQFNGSILVADSGKVIYKKGVGYSDLDKKIPFTSSTSCYIASLSKQFTGMAVMMLREKNKLSYEDPITKWFPDFGKYEKEITVRNLLNHTSGIPDYPRLGIERAGLTNDEVLKAVLKTNALDFSPGTKFSYSNSGYVLLAIIVEKVSGLSYHDFLEKNIFKPLKMSSTFVFDTRYSNLKNVAHGYNRFGGKFDYDLLTYGEGGIYSTVEDFYKWHLALLSEKLVKQATIKEGFAKATLTDKTTTNYGFGWGLGENEGSPTTSHAGRYGGFNTYIKRFPNEKHLIVFLTNNDFRNMSAIGNPIVKILFDKELPPLPKLSVANAMNQIYKQKGIAAAFQFYDSAKPNLEYDFDESELNEWGYYLIGLKKHNDAFEALKRNVDEFPGSWITQDSLGEIYMILGNKEMAIKHYKKSLELNPKNDNAISMLKKLEEK